MRKALDVGRSTGAPPRTAATKEEDEAIRIPIAAVIAALAIAAPAVAAPTGGLAQRRHMPHHPECFTLRCAREADRSYARKHRPKFVVTTFDLCVANQEEGDPGATTMSTVRWDTQQGVYEGGYSEENSKWLAGRGGRFAAHAYEATPIEQIKTFHENGRKGEWTLSNWPTIARC